MPRIIGAVVPSSKYLADKMVSNIDFDRARCIVEYGPGTGVFTEKLLAERRQDTEILLIEYNCEFYRLLLAKYAHEPNVYIINDSAECIHQYLNLYRIPLVDYFVSGLPFASLPAEVSDNILNKSRKLLSEEGKFIAFQYTLLKMNMMKQFFGKIRIKWEVRNLPPAFVFICGK
jgi:phospholipid N-methyltransferase